MEKALGPDSAPGVQHLLLQRELQQFLQDELDAAGTEAAE